MLDIVETISLDQSLTAAVLRQANSAASGNRVRIGTVRDAVVRLGMNMVLSIALSGHLSKQMTKAVPEYGLGAGELWKHSVHRLDRRRPHPRSLAGAGAHRGRHRRARARHRQARAVPLHEPARARAHRPVGRPGGRRRLRGRAQGAGGAPRRRGRPGGRALAPARLDRRRRASYHHTPDEHPEPICYAVALGDMVADYLMGPGAEVIAGAGQRVPVIEDLALEGRPLEWLADALDELSINPDGCHELVYATAERYVDVRSRYLIDED